MTHSWKQLNDTVTALIGIFWDFHKLHWAPKGFECVVCHARHRVVGCYGGNYRSVATIIAQGRQVIFLLKSLEQFAGSKTNGKLMQWCMRPRTIKRRLFLTILHHKVRNSLEMTSTILLKRFHYVEWILTTHERFFFSTINSKAYWLWITEPSSMKVFANMSYSD